MEKLRAIIQQARDRQNISYESIAEALGVPVETLRAFGTGRSSIQADVLFGLVNLLNISPEVVMPILSELGWSIDSDSHIDLLIEQRSS